MASSVDYNNYSSAGASQTGQYYSGSGGGTASKSEGRPKSATRRRDEPSSGRGVEESAAYRGGSAGSRYVPEEEQYPTAHGLIRK